MKSDIMETLARQARSDGDQTRAAIIRAAGELFGEQGYDRTTSKAICQHANVNMAAINYHFGSRDGLYLAVLREVHANLMSLNNLQALAEADFPPAERLRNIIHEFTWLIFDENRWEFRVWIREILSPSPLWDQIQQEQLRPKFNLVGNVIAEICGKQEDDPQILSLMLSVMSPFVLLLLAIRSPSSPIEGLFERSSEEIAESLWNFAMAGLKAYNEKQPG